MKQYTLKELTTRGNIIDFGYLRRNIRYHCKHWGNSLEFIEADNILEKQSMMLGLEKFNDEECITFEYCDDIYNASPLKSTTYFLIPISELKRIGISKEEEFPEKWCIKQNASQVVCDWFNKNYKTWAKVSGGFIYLANDKNCQLYMSIPEGYTEITLEQFKEHILKTPMNKEIIGYKIKESCNQYKEAALKIAKCSNFLQGELVDFHTNSTSFNNLKNAGVLDLWFDVIYKQEITEKTVKIGDRDVKINSKGEIIGKEFQYDIVNWENTIAKYLHSSTNMITKSGSNYPISVETLSLGCVKNVTLDQIQQLINTYYELNPKK